MFDRHVTYGNRIQTDSALCTMLRRRVTVHALLGLRKLLQLPVRRLVELVQPALPATVCLYPDLDAAEDHLLAALKVDTQLNGVTIIDGEGFRF